MRERVRPQRQRVPRRWTVDTPTFRSQVLMQLRVEREQLEHQLLLITGFKEAEVAKIVGDLHLPALYKPKDDDDGKELVHA